jgi:hypothetical protein
MVAIVNSISRNFNELPQIVNMEVDVSLATVAATGWLALPSVIAAIELLNSGLWVWQPSDMVLVYSSLDNNESFFKVNLTTNSLVLYSTAGNGAVTLPVVSGDFTVFDGTLGALKDLGFSASDPTKTKVVMAGSATQVNYIAHFVDTAGTVDDTAANIQNDGNIQAGKSGVAGNLISFPGTAANGSLIISALNAGGAFNTTIRNSVMGQSSVISIPDPGAATANFVLDTAASQTINGNLVVTGSIASNAGNITSGSSGDAGSFISFPGTAANGTLIVLAVNAGGAFNTTISNSAMGQSSTISIPDPGLANSKFVLTDSATSQTIATGNLNLTLGSITLAAGSFTASQGNVVAGSSGHAGTLTSFPATAANGSLIIQAVNAGGAFNTTIASGVMGQSTVYTIPDIGAATGDIVVSTAAVRMKSVGGAAAAGGNAAQSFTDTFCTTGSNVIGNWNTQANAASVLKIVPGNGSFVVTSSADAGVGTFNYIILK